MLMLLASNPVEHVAQHTFWGFGEGFWSFPIISNHILMQVIAAALLVLVIPRAVRMRVGNDEIGRYVPRGLGNAIEALCVALREHVGIPALGRKHVDTFMPYVWSVFFFILTCNLLGLLPLSNLTFFIANGHLIGGTATANFWNNLMLAVLTLVMVVGNGLRYNGWDYIKHFFVGPPGMNVFIAVLEMIGLIVRTVALAIRLFANMVAGHMLLAVLLSFVQLAYMALGGLGGTLVTLLVIGGSVAINFLEILVAFLQAFIFTVLTAVFIGMAVNIHHDEHEEHAEAAHAEQPVAG